MTDSVKDQLNEDLEKVKATGGTRANRIWDIVQTAASQVFAEVKEGSGEIGSIAKTRFSNPSQTVSETIDGDSGETPAETAGQWTGSTFSNLILNFFNAIKEQMTGLDATLTERYGDRYQSTKQRLEETASWYTTTLEKAKAANPQPTALEQKQIELAAKLGEAGTTVANKEQQIREQLKEMVKAASEKR